MTTYQTFPSQEVQSLVKLASSFAAEFASQHPELSTAQLNFGLIVEADRASLPLRVVQALPALSFSIASSADGRGLRYMLWKPIVEFVQKTFVVEIEEWLCSGEVALVYLTNEVAAFSDRLIGPIEGSRLKIPFRSESAAYGVAVNVFCDVELQLKYDEPEYSALIHQIREQNRPCQSTMQERECDLREDLIKLLEKAPSWIIELFFNFLSQQLDEQHNGDFGIELASQEVLAKVWLSAEEEQAWRDL